tara:strand:+ start:372 stop:989 length:618 start_codon:yes stop_codon:yes gene_type:complete
VRKNIKLVLFDLDGVIFDTKTNMKMSWQKVQKVFNIKNSFNSYFKHIGLPFHVILKKLRIKGKINKINETYRKESIKKINNIKLYPGVKKTLEALNKRKIKLGIVTSKDRIRTLRLIKKFKVKISLVVSPSKKLRGKPYPDQLLKAMKISKINSSKTIYVGDMFVDYKAAKNSSIGFVHTRYGYGKKKSLYKYSIGKFKDLSKII